MIKKNNPGNIRRVKGAPWKGEKVPVPFVNGFCEFYTLADGYRALLKLLNTYISKGYDNISKIITRYAPPVENDTYAYISFIESDTGINRNTKIPLNDWNTISKIAWSISEIEHSGNLQNSDYTALIEGYKAVNNTSLTPEPQTAGVNWFAAVIILLIALAVKK